MREIKFRAWDKDLLKYSEIATQHPIEDIEYLTDYDWEQYTGLKDKNGVEIFEGDVVRGYSFMVYSVVFERGCFCASDLKIDSKYTMFDFFSAVGIENAKGLDCEIIGNIHENPELLK